MTSEARPPAAPLDTAPAPRLAAPPSRPPATPTSEEAAPRQTSPTPAREAAEALARRAAARAFPRIEGPGSPLAAARHQAPAPWISGASALAALPWWPRSPGEPQAAPFVPMAVRALAAALGEHAGEASTEGWRPETIAFVRRLAAEPGRRGWAGPEPDPMALLTAFTTPTAAAALGAIQRPSSETPAARRAVMGSGPRALDRPAEPPGARASALPGARPGQPLGAAPGAPRGMGEALSRAVALSQGFELLTAPPIRRPAAAAAPFAPAIGRATRASSPTEPGRALGDPRAGTTALPRRAFGDPRAPATAPTPNIALAVARALRAEAGPIVGAPPASLGERLAAVMAQMGVRLGLTVATTPAGALDAPWLDGPTGTLLVPVAGGPPPEGAPRARPLAASAASEYRPTAPGARAEMVSVPLLERLFPTSEAAPAQATRASLAPSSTVGDLLVPARPDARAPQGIPQTSSQRIAQVRERALGGPTTPRGATGVLVARLLRQAAAAEPRSTLGERLAEARSVAFGPSRPIEGEAPPAARAALAQRDGGVGTLVAPPPGAPAIADSPESGRPPDLRGARAEWATNAQAATTGTPDGERFTPLAPAMARVGLEPTRSARPAPGWPAPSAAGPLVHMGAAARHAERFAIGRIEGAPEGARVHGSRPVAASAPGAAPRAATAWPTAERTQVRPVGQTASAATTSAPPGPSPDAVSPTPGRWPAGLVRLVEVWQQAEALVDAPPAAPRLDLDLVTPDVVGPAATPRPTRRGSGRPGLAGVHAARLGATLLARSSGAAMGLSPETTVEPPSPAAGQPSLAAMDDAGWTHLVAPNSPSPAGEPAPARRGPRGRLSGPENVERALVTWAAAAERTDSAEASAAQAVAALGSVGQLVRSNAVEIGGRTVDVPLRASTTTGGGLFGDRGPGGLVAPELRPVLVEPGARAAEQALRSTPGQRPQRGAETNEEARHRLADQIDEDLSPEETERIAREVIERLKRELEFDAARTGDDAWD